MSAGTQRGSFLLRVPQDAYDELVAMQRAWEAEHPGGTISLGTIVGQLLADRKADQP